MQKGGGWRSFMALSQLLVATVLLSLPLATSLKLLIYLALERLSMSPQGLLFMNCAFASAGESRNFTTISRLNL